MSKDIIPAGSMAPEEEEPGYVEEPEQEAPVEEPEVVEPQEEPEPKEDWKTRYEEAQKAIGRQGKELGDQRKQISQLSETIKSMQASTDSTPTMDDQLADISNKLDNGDIGVAEAMRLTAQIGAQMASAKASEQFQQFRQQQDVESLQSRFLKENPDFNEVVQSGALDDIKAANPLHDDMSAFYAYKAQQASTAAEERARAEYEKGKTEGAKLAQGAEKAGKVLSRPGATVRQTNPANKPMGEKARIDAMTAALQQARGG